MPRYKKYDYSQAMILPVEFSKQILSGTIEYVIDYMVENKLNLEKIEAKYKNDETGAPAYDPKILLKIVLLAYTRGVTSSREIEKLCNENILFKALSADANPDFTTIAWFVRSMEKDVRGLFCDVLMVCSEMNLIGGTIFALDGCKLSSNAAKEWSGKFSDLEKKKEKLKKVLRHVVTTHKQTDMHESKTKIEKKAQIRRIKCKIDAYIPDQFFRKRDPRFITKARHVPKKNAKFTKEYFTYRKVTNDFICPNAKILKFMHNQKFGNTEGRKFSAKGSECKKCAVRKRCLRSDNSRQRTLYIADKYFNRNYSEEMMRKMDTPHGRQIYSMRMGIIEPVFGNIRAAKGLNEFSLRSEAKVNIQWLLYGMVHNLGKIKRYGSIK